MTRYYVHITSFPKGLNLYTGTMQVGHSYIKITNTETYDCEQVRVPITQEFVDSLSEEDKLYYFVGELTSRLLVTKDEALDLAHEWMKEHHPDDVLVDFTYAMTDGDDGHMIYPVKEYR